MNSKLIGGVLLVVGTTIGAGMLALPIATADSGFLGSMVLLMSCWAVMTLSAFIFLEVNLWLPPHTNIISMAGATLGRWGQALAWIVYLLLLYTILSAYIAGGGDLFHYLLSSRGIETPVWASSLFFTALLGIVVYFGIRAVDYVNRGLMFGKLGAYFLLVLFILPFVSSDNLASGAIKHITSATSITVTAVAFGCIMIIPSLRSYFGDDIKSLRKAIFIGSLIPLVCYIFWDMVIMGVIPLEGEHGLNQMLHSASANSDLVASLTSLIQRNFITVLTKFFTSICMATSFLSVSLCLSDFLADGLKVQKQGKGSFFIFSATFLPPILIVLFYPDAFLRGLHYAGICCLILMILLPAMMAWGGRYYRALAQTSYVAQDRGGFEVPGGKSLLLALIVFAILMIGQGMFHS